MGVLEFGLLGFKALGFRVLGFRALGISGLGFGFGAMGKTRTLKTTGFVRTFGKK